MTTISTALSAEHDELLSTLATHRQLLRHTVEGLTDEQAALRTTASELCLGGLVKHVAAMEAACDVDPVVVVGSGRVGL